MINEGGGGDDWKTTMGLSEGGHKINGEKNGINIIPQWEKCTDQNYLQTFKFHILLSSEYNIF